MDPTQKVTLNRLLQRLDHTLLSADADTNPTPLAREAKRKRALPTIAKTANPSRLAAKARTREAT
jgi:hypothetical protein